MAVPAGRVNPVTGADARIRSTIELVDCEGTYPRIDTSPPYARTTSVSSSISVV